MRIAALLESSGGVFVKEGRVIAGTKGLYAASTLVVEPEV
jgi:hypothetical protein